MSLPLDYVSKLSAVPILEVIEIFENKNCPQSGTRWILKNELRPVDLYCYLGAKFGAPNGIQNILRSDDSDNLVHWEWFVRTHNGFMTIQGLNFRTEVLVYGGEALTCSDKEQFVTQVKNEFAQYGAEMNKIRKVLEPWVEFVNPYQRLRRAVRSLVEELSSLGLRTEQDTVPDLDMLANPEVFKDTWNEKSTKYSRAFGLCFGVRSMLPVMAEAFVNLLLYVLMKPEIKIDERVRENIFRQPIDVRVRSLFHNCVGFARNVDYSSDACKRYHSLVNERNDLLHGNVVIDKLKFNELYFHRTVPIFINYLSMWERSLGVGHRSVGLDKVNEELSIVEDFIEYLMSCLADEVREQVKLLSNKFDLGVNKSTGGLGILFSDTLADMVLMESSPRP